MTILVAVLQTVALGGFSLSVILLAFSALARRDYVLRGDEIWRLFSESPGNPTKNIVPQPVREPPAWLRVPSWASDLLERDNLHAGVRYALD